MTKLITVLYLLIFTSCIYAAKGQTFYYKNYTVDDGLPSTEVYHVIQDEKGFIWIATSQGVSRFDGYHFVNFDNQSGLPRNTILDLFEDKKGRIWFISLLGELSWFENDSIHIYSYNNLIVEYNKGNYGRAIKRNFYADTLNNIYIGFHKKPLIHITPEGVLHEITPDSINHKQILKVFPDDNMVISNYRDSKEDLEIRFNKDSVRTVKGFDRLKSHFLLSKDEENFFIANVENLMVINKRGKIYNHSFKRNIIWLSKDSENNIWIGFPWEGVKAFSNLDFSTEKYSILKGKSVSSVLRDSEGGYWFSTLENGLYYYPSLNIKSITQKSGIKPSSINQVEHQNDKIWFAGNSNELYYLKDEELNVEHSIYKNQDIHQCVFIKDMGDSIGFYFDGKRIENLKIISNFREIWSHQQYSRGVLSIGHDSILLFFKAPMIVNLYDRTIDYEIKTDKFTDIYDAVNYDDNVWLGTDKGLFEFNLKSNKINEINNSPLLRSRINCILKDNDIVWIGTKGAGLLKMYNDSILQITDKDGLPENSINVIQKQNNVLWLATNNGVAKLFLNKYGQIKRLKDSSEIKTDNVFIEYFNRSIGLINNEIYDIALDDKNVYVGTSRGLSYFNQRLSGINNVAPPVYIESIKIMGKDTIVKDFYELKNKQNYIEFSFVGISYQREKSLKYAYKLDGIDRDWHKTENQSVQYHMLPPGNYTFKVKAYNRSGIESEQIKTISIKIKKAFFQTTIFKISVYLVLTMFIVLIFLAIYYTNLKKVKKKNRISNEINRYRQQALSAQMNPHFIYNTLNSVQSYILKNEREKSSVYLSKFGKLMRQILDISQFPIISLKEEIEAMKVYMELELNRFHNAFKFHLSVGENVDIENIKVPPLIIQPYIENAIHHGLRLKHGEKNLWIEISQSDEKTYIVIKDDGIGREESQRIRKKSGNRLKSYGTEITKKRLSLFKELYKNEVYINISDLTDINNNCNGTKVEIEILNIDIKQKFKLSNAENYYYR